MKSLQTSFAAMNKQISAVAKIALALCLLLLVFCASLLLGSASLGFADFADAFSAFPKTAGGRILRHLRLPRILAAVAAGAGLAGAGVLIQTLLANPLAGPNIIGVNAGAGFAVLLCGVLLPTMPLAVPIAAFLGAIGAVSLLWGIGRKTGASRSTLILTGIALNSLLNAAADGTAAVFPDVAGFSSSFRVGGFAAVSVRVLPFAVGIIIVCLIIAFLFSNELDLLSLGDDTAAALGMRVSLWRGVFLVLAAALAGASVSIAGLLGFVGLLVPHLARFFVGGESRFLLPLSAVFGAALTLGCDTLGRTLFAPYELPAGIFLSFLGAPFFLWLLVRKKGGHGV